MAPTPPPPTATAGKRKRNEDNPKNPPHKGSDPHGRNGAQAQDHRFGIIKMVALHSNKGKEQDTRPAKKRREHIPCQPPTIRDGSKTTKLPIEWVVEKRAVWEGNRRREIVKVESDFADQVEGATRTVNPHWTVTTPTPPPSASLNCAIPITIAAFPNIALPEATILGNVRKEVADELRKNHNEYMALVPIGTGNKLYENARELTTTAADLVNAIANDNSQYTVAAPVREGEPPHGARFAKPFAMILQRPSDGLRRKLLEAKTLAFRTRGKGYAFVATAISPEGRSWVVCNYRGSPVTNDTSRMADALKAIGEQVASTAGLRALANRILKEENIGHTAEERIQVVIAGLSLIFVNRLNESGCSDPVWQLHGRPLTTNGKNNKEWLRAVCQINFFMDATTVLEQDRKPVSCVWCKSEIHTSPFCPIPQVKDWLGPPVSQETLTPEPRDTRTSREGKRGPKKGSKGKGKGN